MKPRIDNSEVQLRRAKYLAAMMLVLTLTGCTLGEAEMPSVAAGAAADRSAGMVAPVPAPIPHALDGRQECFACHAIGAVDAPPVPADHDQDVTMCSTCHAVWLAPAIAAAAPPAVRHELEGRADCLTCHKLGTGDAPRVPDNHSGLTSRICMTCHTSAGEIAGVGDGAAPIPDSPSIPHPLEGFGACTQCHGVGGPGIPLLPDDHQGRTDDLCSACHRPAAEAPADALATGEGAVPSSTGNAARGRELFATNCAVCHGPSGEGTSIAPSALNDAALLGDRTDEDLAGAIRKGVADKMPPFPELSDEDVRDLIAFHRSWQ
jgi:cytochrome c553